jgi:hypothetical protein
MLECKENSPMFFFFGNGFQVRKWFAFIYYQSSFRFPHCSDIFPASCTRLFLSVGLLASDFFINVAVVCVLFWRFLQAGRSALDLLCREPGPGGGIRQTHMRCFLLVSSLVSFFSCTVKHICGRRSKGLPSIICSSVESLFSKV